MEQLTQMVVCVCARPPASQVDDVVDVNMTKQGEPGYTNEAISPGDLILAVDGRDVQRIPLSELHDLLRGTCLP